jgi:hypothetical protein
MRPEPDRFGEPRATPGRNRDDRIVAEAVSFLA